MLENYKDYNTNQYDYINNQNDLNTYDNTNQNYVNNLNNINISDYSPFTFGDTSIQINENNITKNSYSYNNNGIYNDNDGTYVY